MFFDNLTNTSSKQQNPYHFTRQKLLQMMKIYEFCKNAQSNIQARDIVNTKFAKIVEDAKNHIHDFSLGKISVDSDAIDLMKEYIEEFGKEYVNEDNQLKYKFTDDALKAKIKLQQLSYKQNKQTLNSVQDSSVSYNFDALMRGTADEFVEDLNSDETPVSSDTNEEVKGENVVAQEAFEPIVDFDMIQDDVNNEEVKGENVVAQEAFEPVVDFDMIQDDVNNEEVKGENVVAQEAFEPVVDFDMVQDDVNNEEVKGENVVAQEAFEPVVDFDMIQDDVNNEEVKGENVANQNISEQQPQKSEKKKSSPFSLKKVKSFYDNTAHKIHNSFTRYGAASVALFGGLSFYNGYTMPNTTLNHNLSSARLAKSITISPIDSLSSTKEASANSDTLDLTAYFCGESYLDGDTLDCMQFDFRTDLEKATMKAQAIQDSILNESKKLTLAELSAMGYTFSQEDLAAMTPSETAQNLANAAEDVAQNMNCGGLCYKGVKKAFNKTGMGQMYGGSAYMAKKQLDNNDKFVQINSDVQNNRVIPDGGVAVFGRSAAHPHGHIGVFKDGKDCSSKVRNAMTSVGRYSSFDVYLPADIEVPDIIQKKIESISVLKRNYRENFIKETAPNFQISPFLLAVQQTNTIG